MDSDGYFYTRAEFLSAYSSGSNEWDAAAGLDQSCWDATYTYTRCCCSGGATPDGSGDALCWAGDITYANCMCENPCDSLSCGAHGVCDAATSACVCLTVSLVHKQPADAVACVISGSIVTDCL